MFYYWYAEVNVEHKPFIFLGIFNFLKSALLHVILHLMYETNALTDEAKPLTDEANALTDEPNVLTDKTNVLTDEVDALTVSCKLLTDD